MLNIRAICAAVFRPEMTASATSRRLISSSFLRRPRMRPSALAAARPAEVRPTGNGIEVVEGLTPSFCNQLGAGRLSIPGLISGPAL